MTRILFCFWLIALLLGPVRALGLEIGEIQVHSALNQLFDARIPLPNLTPEELGRVSVKLAPAPIFKEFGLERAPTLTNLVFSIEYNAEGQVYVKVISTKPIQEPSLGLLLEFGWPRGKTFREFTVFLDPVQRLAQRPGDRSKTMLDAPPTTPAPPVEPAPATGAAPVEPAPVAATAAPERDAQGTGGKPESEPAAPVTTEAVGMADPAPLPVEAPPAPARVYRPGDTYGPVTEGEGLWGIALKVRPDPGITRDQMMQSLFQANPHAFGKGGIDALKTGAVLRIPSFQEIADLTGSATARHLAETERSMAVATTPPRPAPAATEPAAATAAPPALEVFPLEPLELPEPIADVALPSTPPPEVAPLLALPEPATPPSGPVAVEPDSIPAIFELTTMIPAPLALLEPPAVAAWSPPPALKATPPLATPEPVIPSSEPAFPEAAQPVATPAPARLPSEALAAETESEPVPAQPESGATAPEPASLATEPVAVESEPVAHAEDVLREPLAVAPVSVTPLLFLAVSEMVATIAQPPTLTIPETATTPLEPKASAIPEPPAATAATETPVSGATIMPESAPVPMAAVKPPTEASATETFVPGSTPPESPAVPMDTASLLAVVEQHLPRMNQNLPWQTYLASDVSLPVLPPLAQSPPDATLTADAITPPAAEAGEVPAPVVSAAPQLLAADLTEPSVKMIEPSAPQRQDSDQYGPVAPNERLWDIATKVRPDPAIGKEHMMKALLKANPQAFSKPNSMDSLKVGAILRIPTLREIAEYTDSKVARELLEQQETAETPSPPAPEPPTPTPEPAPVAETTPVPEPPAPEPEPVNEAPSALEPLASGPAAEALPASESSAPPAGTPTPVSAPPPPR